MFHNKSFIVKMLASERREDVVGPMLLSAVIRLLAHIELFLLKLTNYLLHFCPTSTFVCLISLSNLVVVTAN